LGERSGAPSGLRPSTFVMSDTPVEVQFTSAGCLNYPCRTPVKRTRPNVRSQGNSRRASETETIRGPVSLRSAPGEPPSIFTAEPPSRQRPFRNPLSGVQLVQQGLGLLQIERVESLRKPCADSRGSAFGQYPAWVSADRAMSQESIAWQSSYRLNAMTLPALDAAQYLAHTSISLRRLSNRSPRR
jgi:hypothetical protein